MLTFSVVSCGKKYYTTAKVCNGSLYVETFRINPAGEYADYLTDSVNFRIYIGIFDPEEDLYSYTCKGDSIIVEKFNRGRESDYHTHETLSKKVYSLRELRRKHELN